MTGHEEVWLVMISFQIPCAMAWGTCRCVALCGMPERNGNILRHIGEHPEANTPHASGTAPDVFMLWQCSGSITVGHDGVNHLHGHPIQGMQRLPTDHATGKCLEVQVASQQRHAGCVSGQRVFAVGVALDTVKNGPPNARDVPVDEYRSVLEMGMHHLGRVVGVMPSEDFQNTETVLLFMVTQELGDNENGEEVWKGIWLREVVIDGEGREEFWLEEEAEILESNVLCLEGRAMQGFIFQLGIHSLFPP